MLNKPIARWLLTALLFFLPFQRKIVKNIAPWSNELSSFISYLDEIIIVIFLPIALIRLYRNGEIKHRSYLMVLSPIVVLCISGVTSGMINGNSFFITALGIFDYIINFLVIFIYAAYISFFIYLVTHKISDFFSYNIDTFLISDSNNIENKHSID
jgi:hypothetical protein